MQEKVLNFLTKYEMQPQTIDLEAVTAAFSAEMTRGLKKEPSSLMMIPTYLDASGAITQGEKAIAIDAGGTNLRVAVVTFGPNGAEVSDLRTWPMPGTNGSLTKGEFLSAMADHLMPVIDQADKIGFCFSYPAEILPNKDARVIRFCKEVDVVGAEGMLICSELEAALASRGAAGKRVILLNDTVAALLGGLQFGVEGASDGYMGFILGTGTNTCYVEKCANISAVEAQSGSMIVNIESGIFDKFPQGEFEKRYDRLSAIPGDHLLEKSVSGVYLCEIIYHTLLQAGEDGLLSAATTENIRSAGLSGVEVDDFMRQPKGSGKLAGLCASDEDREVLQTIIDQAFERAARLVCATLAGVMVTVDGGKTPETPMNISAEGSTFWKSYVFRPKLDALVKEYINGKLHRWCRFTNAENANLAGAAAAAILNS